MARPATPAQQRPVACTCAGLGFGPVSLAATPGVSVDFLSSGYLDVSVPHVRLPYGMTGLQPAGLPHSEI